MRLLVRWTLAAALLAAAAPAPARAQTMQQVVDAKRTAVTKKIDGAKVPDAVRTAFRARLAQVASIQLDGQLRELDRIDVDVTNNEGAYAEWQRVDSYIRAQTDLTPKTRDYYAGLMQDVLGKMLPNNSGQLWSQVASYKAYVDDNKRLLAGIREYMKTVTDDRAAPAILKQQTLKRLQAMIDLMGTPGVSASFRGLQDEQTDFKNHMITVTELDKFAQRVQTEAPVAYPAFIANTKAEIAGMRANVGNPMGNTSLQAVQAFQTRYANRLVLIRLCADIKAKIPQLPAEDRASYQRSLDGYAANVVDWHGSEGPDEERIRRLYNNIMDRFRK